MQETSDSAPKLEFFTARQHAYLLKAAPPIPAGMALPKWYRETDTHFRNVTPFQVYPPELKLRQNATIRTCAGIRDYLTGGYVLPLWADFAITFDGNDYRWESPQPDFAIEKHHPEQYATMPKVGFPIVLKFMSPWYCRTSPGYSVRLLPCFYHFDQIWKALPGVVHTDSIHATHVNVQFELTRGQLVLPQGMPFVHVIPYRRETYELDVHVGSEQDMEAVEATRRQLARFFHDPDIYPGAKGTT